MEDKLIEQVRLHEILFNCKLASYRDQHVRQEAWEDIGRELKISAEKSKDLWNKLRRCFCNAISRRRDKKSGLATKKNTPWKFEQQMSFILPHLEKRKTTSNWNTSIVNEEQDTIIEIDQNVDVKIEENESLDESDQDVQSFENVEYFETKEIKPPEKAKKQIDKVKKNKKRISNNNPSLKMLKVMKENTSLRKPKHNENNIKPNTCTIFQNMDETDLFFLSMSKMTKQLPPVQQAKIKLSLSNSVLQAEIINSNIQTSSLSTFYQVPSETAKSSSQYSNTSSEESQICYDAVVN